MLDWNFLVEPMKKLAVMIAFLPNMRQPNSEFFFKYPIFPPEKTHPEIVKLQPKIIIWYTGEIS